jgi:hypothetical protein
LRTAFKDSTLTTFITSITTCSTSTEIATRGAYLLLQESPISEHAYSC